MMKINNKKYSSKGLILPTTLVLTFSSFWIISGYLWWLDDKINELEYKIAVTKATYNAESGIADFVYPFLINTGFTKDTLYKPEDAGEIINPYLDSEISFPGSEVFMGSYDANASNWGYNEDINDSIRYNFIKSSAISSGKIRGVAYWGPLNSDGSCCKSKVTRTSELSVSSDGWGRYMYYTASESAGGGPWTFDPPYLTDADRRSVCFWGPDVMQGVVQSSSLLTFCGSGGCPDFSDASWYFSPGFDGPQDWGQCSNEYYTLFQTQDSEGIDTLTTCQYQFPPNMNSSYDDANIIIPADYMLRASNGTGLKDTLIMTDIEFFSNGGVQVYQWWYLMPPHLKKYKGNQTTNNPSDFIQLNEYDQQYPKPHHIDGFDELFEEITGNNWTEYNYWDDQADNFSFLNQICNTTNFSNQAFPMNNITCKHYLDSLRAYHGKDVSTTNGFESYMNPSISGHHGIVGQHFDFHNGIDQNGNGQIEDSLLVYEEYFSYNVPSVIYVKGGPVRVRGTYKGQWTVLTDSETEYQRHAWRDTLEQSPPIDKVLNNIYIVDDLINADSFNGNMGGLLQPDEETCNGGSDNVMGLLSGANIVVASTRKNGLGDGAGSCSTVASCNQNISSVKINAAMMALDESFVVQYWQNSTANQAATNYSPFNYESSWWNGVAGETSPTNDDFYEGANQPGDAQDPPGADGRGRIKSNDNNVFPSQTQDRRGVIYLWGGVVQKNRGYVRRSANSPYGNAEVGYVTKDYNFDDNVRCNEPPGWPPLQCLGDSTEVDVTIIGSITKKN